MQTARPALTVSIHDVSPLTWERTDEMLADLAKLGIGGVSLLVIPNHHHKAPVSQAAEFCGWLREQAAAGHENVLHGYYHLRQKTPDDGPWKRLVTSHYTAGEGEFFDLSKPEANTLLARGKEDFAANGISTRGFIAPAWLLGSDAEQAVKDAGFEYTTRIATFHDLKTGRTDAAQSLVWSVRAAWRRTVSLAWNKLLFEKMRTAPLLRIGLHPPDWNHEAIRGQCLQLISAALAGRDAITYEQWLDRQRAL